MPYITITIGCVLTIFLVYVVGESLSLPDVHFSYDTDECVQVINYSEGDTYSCDNLPNKYHHAWVK